MPLSFWRGLSCNRCGRGCGHLGCSVHPVMVVGIAVLGGPAPAVGCGLVGDPELVVLAVTAEEAGLSAGCFRCCPGPTVPVNVVIVLSCGGRWSGCRVSSTESSSSSSVKSNSRWLIFTNAVNDFITAPCSGTLRGWVAAARTDSDALITSCRCWFCWAGRSLSRPADSGSVVTMPKLAMTTATSSSRFDSSMTCKAFIWRRQNAV